MSTISAPYLCGFQCNDKNVGCVDLILLFPLQRCHCHHCIHSTKLRQIGNYAYRKLLSLGWICERKELCRTAGQPHTTSVPQLLELINYRV